MIFRHKFIRVNTVKGIETKDLVAGLVAGKIWMYKNPFQLKLTRDTLT